MEELKPVIVQDSVSGEVLMLGYSNAEALELTGSTGYLHFWSRSRGRIWMKGESSGNRLRVVEISEDCDRDALLARVVVEGKGLVCHEGRRSCFGSGHGVETNGSSIQHTLAQLFEQRMRERPAGSHVVEVLDRKNEAYKKLGEETVEFMLAAVEDDRKHAVAEAADMYFHMLLALYYSEISYDEVVEELKKRMH